MCRWRRRSRTSRAPSSAHRERCAAALPILVLLAALLTLAAALLRGRLRADSAVPFGPGLAAAIWGMWLIAG